MTNLEKAVQIIVNDYKTTLQNDYSDWDINSWSDMIEAFGQDSRGVKEDVIYVLMGANIYLNDDCELEEQDGTTISYRKLMNEVRKEMKNRVFK
jgi:hypothetical protein